MSSLLNNASLLFNPAGSIISYQEDKIYSVLPKDGTGDFTFSGGDGGTRVNQQGYIEQTPANLVLNSEIFGSGWNLGATTITSNSVIAPNGTLTADSSLSNSGVAAHVVYQFFPSVNGTYTFSCYVKKANSRYVEIKIAGTAVNWVAAVFDLDTATVTKSQASNWTGLATTITNVGDGWYRFSISGTGTTDASFNAGIQYVDSATPTFAANYADVIVNGSGVVDYYIWGAMLNIGSTALPYQPTTDRLNYPRITYQNGRGAVLNEPQRTNLVLYSQQFDAGGWVQYNNGTITANSTTSPDGTQNAYTLNVATTGYSGLYRIVSGGTGVATVSGFFKKGTIDWVLLANTAGNDGVAWFNLANGTIGTVDAGYSATIEPLKDGWYRCSMTGPSQNIAIWQIAGATSDNNTTPAYAGNIYIWGAQVEVGSLPTSYIPTTSATVTRVGNSDYPYVGNVYQNGIVGQNNFTLYGDIFPQGSANTDLNGGLLFTDNTYANYIFVGSNAGGLIYTDGSAGGSYQSGVALGSPKRYKIAANCFNGLVKIFANGILQKTFNNSSFVNSNTTQYRAYHLPSGNTSPGVGNSQFFLGALYNTALTDAQCQELTTVRSGSGGTISYYGPYTIHTFTGSATFTPSFNGEVEVLVVAGGGGGGNNHAGGGGAGGLLYVSSYGVSAGTGITVTVGAGGTSPVSNPDPVTNGSNSVFGGLTAIGGGGGGSRNDSNNNSPGGSGGSGGGGGGSQNFLPGNQVPGNGILGQGNNGGYGIDIYGGGGGGAGAVGTVGAASSAGGNGGNGLPYSISGFSTYYAGGGGGGYCPIAGGGNGGLGGGGKGGILVTDKGTPGVPYTGAGGGGGGAGGTQGSIGGAGIVIVRYLT
jgi:hypothetical protein